MNRLCWRSVMTAHKRVKIVSGMDTSTSCIVRSVRNSKTGRGRRKNSGCRMPMISEARTTPMTAIRNGNKRIRNRKIATKSERTRPKRGTTKTRNRICSWRDGRDTQDSHDQDERLDSVSNPECWDQERQEIRWDRDSSRRKIDQNRAAQATAATARKVRAQRWKLPP